MKKIENFLSGKALLMLRLTIALMFFLHALIRVLHNTIPDFAAFLQSKGFIFPVAVVWVITVFELAGSLLLAIGCCTRLLSFLFILLLIAGIVLIHASLGWFVGEHGTGGSEYSVVLIVALFVIAAGDKRK